MPFIYLNVLITKFHMRIHFSIYTRTVAYFSVYSFGRTININNCSTFHFEHWIHISYWIALRTLSPYPLWFTLISTRSSKVIRWTRGDLILTVDILTPTKPCHNKSTYWCFLCYPYILKHLLPKSMTWPFSIGMINAFL